MLLVKRLKGGDLGNWGRVRQRVWTQFRCASTKHTASQFSGSVGGCAGWAR